MLWISIMEETLNKIKTRWFKSKTFLVNVNFPNENFKQLASLQTLRRHNCFPFQQLTFYRAIKQSCPRRTFHRQA